MENIKLYDIQKKFILDAQNLIDREGVGIFSSPTGTGKTMSLLFSLKKYFNTCKNDYENLNLSAENKALIEHLFGPAHEKVNIFYCSRTHAQLNQAMQELKKIEPNIKAVIVGSRKFFCINEDVVKLNDNELISEKCKDLVENSSCKYYNNLPDFDDDFMLFNAKKNILHKEINSSEKKIVDIEDLHKIGKNNNICPYFYAKNYSQGCDILFLPYNLLFSEEGRKSLGIEIRNSIIVVDEAHNIYETVIQMNTILLTNDMVMKYYNAFLRYQEKYEERMLDSNLSKIKDVIKILRRLSDFFAQIKNKPQDYSSMDLNSGSQKMNDNTKMLSVIEFMIKAKIYNFNLPEIEKYVCESKLTQKLEGFGTNLHFQLFNIIKFLRMLIFCDENARIFYNEKYIKFTPLDPKIYFEEILKCKSLILAGGTMEPIENLKSIMKQRNVEYYSYNAICNNFECYILQEGPRRKKIKLNYESKNDKILLQEIMNSLYNLFNTVKKGGIICFIPSKSYITLFKNLVKSYDFKRKVMFDSDCTFQEYKHECEKNNIILFSVLGGRLSEGINFTDELCRLLIVIGVPYPSINVELEERSRYHGKNYTTVIAMKTVNQALGRVLRHKNDFGCIVLLDSRYIKLKRYISPWIQTKCFFNDFPGTLIGVNKFLKNFPN